MDSSSWRFFKGSLCIAHGSDLNGFQPDQRQEAEHIATWQSSLKCKALFAPPPCTEGRVDLPAKWSNARRVRPERGYLWRFSVTAALVLQESGPSVRLHHGQDWESPWRRSLRNWKLSPRKFKQDCSEVSGKLASCFVRTVTNSQDTEVRKAALI